MPVSTHRMKLEDGKISYELKTPYRNGTIHVVFEPLDFIARLAALVPKPRVHLTPLRLQQKALIYQRMPLNVCLIIK